MRTSPPRPNFLFMPERRSQIRLGDSDLVMLFWEGPAGKLMQLCNVKDVSGDGIGLVLDVPLPVGCPVTITYGEGELTGIIKHQSPGTAGQFVGVEFDESSKNSTLHFQPELLIDAGDPKD